MSKHAKKNLIANHEAKKIGGTNTLFKMMGAKTNKLYSQSVGSKVRGAARYNTHFEVS
jgi:hypothetical protein